MAVDWEVLVFEDAPTVVDPTNPLTASASTSAAGRVTTKLPAEPLTAAPASPETEEQRSRTGPIVLLLAVGLLTLISGVMWRRAR